ncbi:hypothetical protein KCP76_21430 [Salmonella enterica subsp. enterica serovar Weltevreden]|nr:hypothetical protein KCP76_21430 [Salmonella enterica subsp. enterica serovar Weltevreden]
MMAASPHRAPRVPELFVVEPFPAVHLLAPLPPVYRTRLHATDLLRAAFPGGSITGA